MKGVGILGTAAVIAGALLLSASCARDDARRESAEASTMVASGSWYAALQWSHDGDPFESSRFIVYSDAASREARMTIAQICEELLDELILTFELDPEAPYPLPEDQAKIDIFVYRDHHPKAWGGCAYYGGLVMWSLDHSWRPKDLDNYRGTIKHEMVHVLQLLLHGPGKDDRPFADRWYLEGMAEAITGGVSGGAIRGRKQLDHLTRRFERVSPIAFSSPAQEAEWSEHMPGRPGYEFLDPMYQLAVEYLMSAEGLGKSPRDLIAVFGDMGEGIPFAVAFERRLGISLAQYEAEFYDRIQNYLPENENAALIWVPRAWIGLIAASLILLVARDLRSGKKHEAGASIPALATLLFGPLGYVMQRITRGADALRANWRRALSASLSGLTGIAAGLVAQLLIFALFLPKKNPADFALLFPFLIGWLLFRAPSLASRSGRPYPIAVLRSLPGALIPSLLALVGLLSLLVPLSENWWFTLDPMTPLFWTALLPGALLSTLLLFPFEFWRAHRAARLQA